MKGGITSTLKGKHILGARRFPNIPYDGYTLAKQLRQASTMSNSNVKDVYVDLGYRGVVDQNPDVSGKYRRITG